MIVIDDMTDEKQVSAKEWEEQFLAPECAELWVTKARLMMLDDHPERHEPSGFEELEECLVQALELDSENLEALEEAAHFSDVMIPDRAKAVMYAQHYIRVAARVVDDMQAIINDSN